MVRELTQTVRGDGSIPSWSYILFTHLNRLFLRKHIIYWISIVFIYSYKVDNLRFATVNARSLKSKEHLISEAMEEFKTDALIVTETWLKDNNEDDQWIKSSELNTNGYEIQKINRINKRGGVALIKKDEEKITSLDTNNYTSFEHKTWNM